MEPIEINKKQSVQKNVEQQLEEKKTITSSMNLGSTKLKQADDIGGSLEYPIMKEALKLPEITELKKPKKEAVLKANREVGLSMSFHALRHPKRVRRAKAKYMLQQNLATRQQKYKQAIRDENYTEADLAGIRTLNLSAMMYDDSKKAADENLIEHYSALKKCFSYIDAYGKSIDEQKKKEGLSEIEKNNIMRNEAHLRTLVDIRTFYEVQEALMSNKYYALLPRDEMKKLSYQVIRARLQKLYEQEEGKRNNELIDYYQNLLRLKQLGITDGESVKKREKSYLKSLQDDTYEDTRNAEEEMEKITDAYVAMLKNFGKKANFLTEQDSKVKRLMFFKTLGKDIDKFRDKAKGRDARNMLFFYDECKWELTGFENKIGGTTRAVDNLMSEEADHLEKRDKALDGISISDNQMARMREIQGFLMRRSWQESRSNDSFVFNLLRMPPEQQLLAFYLIENKRESGALPADFYTALVDYKPNLSKIRDRVNISFYKKGKTKWDIISRAVRSASSLSNEFEEYSETSGIIEKAERRLSETDKNGGEAAEKGRYLVEAISGHTSLLAQFYRGSGLTGDMPLDLVLNGRLREKMYDEYRRIGDLSERLVKLIEDNPDLKVKLDNYAKEGPSPEYTEAEKKSAGKKVLDAAGKSVKVYKTVKTVDDIGGGLSGVLSSTVKKFRSNNSAYNLTRSSLGQLKSFIGFAELLYGFFTENKEDPTLTETSRFIKKVDGRLDVVNTVKSTAESALGVLKNAKVIDGKTRTMDRVNKISKSTGIVTSSLSWGLKAVKLGQAVSNESDIRLAGKMYKNKVAKSKKTRDDRHLERFLSHEKRETRRQKVSAAVNFTKNSFDLAAKIMSITGAPGVAGSVIKIVTGVADFLYKNIYDKSKRKSNIKATVDEFLGVDKVVKQIKEGNEWDVSSLKDKDLRRNARKEALGRLGYTSYKDCFSDICGKFAEFLYGKLFLGKTSGLTEWSIYSTALKALGMADVPYLKDYGDNPQPTIEMIKAKIMG